MTGSPETVPPPAFRYRTLLPQRLAVEPSHRRARGGERALDTARQKSDQPLVDGQLAVDEQL